MFRLFLVFALLASVVMGQQTMVLTFSRGEPGLTRQEGSICYNILSNGSDGYNGTAVQPVTGLQYTDGTESKIGVSVAPLGNKNSCVSEFAGSVESIVSVFGDAAVNGVVSYSTNTAMLTFCNLSAGSYTLTVLAASGNSSSSQTMDEFWLTAGKKGEVTQWSSAAEVIAYSSTLAMPEVALKNDTESVKAYTINTSSNDNYASNWVLFKFDVALDVDVEALKLNASGTGGNIAAVAFSSVPEPTSVVFSLLSVIWVAGYRRRKYSH